MGIGLSGPREADELPPGTSSEGRQFGDYELLEEVGRGGMGVVYRARQISLNRIVAIKMLLARPFAVPELEERLHLEAEAAAGLNHPNIVTIYDFGECDGQFYFSMEYIEGHSLAQLTRHHSLAPTQAAQYLKTVAEAVHHAHEHGILHRDLKPSNILIDLHDQAKVTDFGLAKRLGTDSELTLTGQLVGSPNYLSPEQAAGKHQALTVRSDVYALGAVLYQLLTARPPLVGESLQETLVQIREREAPSPRLLSSGVPRDLETICLKCLQKEPARRYASARELAEDLGRFLEGKPILARPVSPAGRVWRWCQRQPVQASLVAALFAVVVLGFGGVIWQWRQAAAGRQEARTEAAKSQQVAQFLKDMLEGVDPGVAQGRDTTLLREILTNTAARVVNDLTNQPEVEAELLLTLGSTYMKLGEFVEAEKLAREGVRLRTASGKTNALVADSLYVLASIVARRGMPTDLVEAEALLRQTLPLQRRFRGDKHEAVADSMALLAGTLRLAGKPAESEDLYRQALVLRRELFGNEHLDVASTLYCLGLTLRNQEKLNDAEAALREGVEIIKKLPGSHRKDLATSLFYLATVLRRQGKLPDAESKFRETLQTYRQLYGVTNVYTVEVVKGLKECLRQQGKNAELEDLYREELDLRIKGFENQHPEVCRALAALAEELQRQGKLAEAESNYWGAVKMHRELFGVTNVYTATLVKGLADCLRQQGKNAELETLYREELDVRIKAYGNQHPEVCRALAALAEELQRQGKLAEAQDVAQKELALEKELSGAGHPSVAASLSRLGRVLELTKQWTEAEDAYRQALEILREQPESDGPQVGEALSRLVAVLQKEGKLLEAEQLCREMVASQRKRGKETWGLDYALDELAKVLWAEEKFPEALAVKREKLAVVRKLPGEKSKALSYSLMSLADMLRQQGKNAELEDLYREELDLRIKAFGNQHPEVCRALAAFADELQRQGKLVEAEDAYRKALESLKEQPESDSRQVGETLRQLVAVLEEEGKLLEAEQLCRQWVAICRKQGKEDWVLASALNGLAWVLGAKKEPREAMSLTLEALALERKLSAGRPTAVADALFNSAIMLGDQGNLAEAKTNFAEALLLYSKEIERDSRHELGVNWRYVPGLYGHAVMCLGTGDTNGYRATATQIVAQLERRVKGENVLAAWACALVPGAVTNYGLLLDVVTNALARQTNTTRTLYGLQTLGALLCRAGRYPEAARQLGEMYELGLRVDPTSETTAATHGAYFLALSHAQLGQTNQASDWFQRASSLDFLAGGTRAPAGAKVAWWNRLTLQWLRQEAESVLNPRPSPATSPP